MVCPNCYRDNHGGKNVVSPEDLILAEVSYIPDSAEKLKPHGSCGNCGGGCKHRVI